MNVAVEPAPRSPFAHPAFRALWTAATISYVGSFVQDVAERWLILDLTKSPLSVAMLSTVLVSASFVAVLPAGVLADRFDRRRLVIGSQVAQAAISTVLAFATWRGHVTPAVLLVGSAAAGIALALGSPAWTALVSEILPLDQVAEGVTLNAISFNIARTVGPAIGGLVLGALGAGWSFLLNAATFIAVIVAVLMHRRGARTMFSQPPPPMRQAFVEPFTHALRELGVRSAFFAMLLFTAGASFVYALAPAFAKLTLEADPRAYGLMIGAMGVGAIVGGAALKPLRRKLSPRTLIVSTMIVYGMSSIALARVHSVALAIAVYFPAGVGWTASFSSLSALVQTSVPNRMRARIVALYTMAHYAVWAVGGAMGGAFAERQGVRASMIAGGVMTICAALATARMSLPSSFSGKR